jgi:alkanesulfonate monooxygenase SsuD/methylene tetrahydromethanopterin reductase-like flavin-dependent oxidoreductase (luciferase family)
MSRPLAVGVGSWNLRSTARRPRTHTALYRDLLADALVVEQLGFDSLWLSEHRTWYDGWCPQPVLAAAAVLAATARLRVGTAIHLLPQHDPQRAARAAATTATLFPERLQLGVGLGYRAEEFAALGLELRDRSRLLEAGLEALRSHGYAEPLRIGGRSEQTARRAARTGNGVLLPPGLTRDQLEAFIATLRVEAAAAGRAPPPVGLMCDVWIDDDGDRARSHFNAVLRRHYGEYTRAWWARLPDGRPDEPKIARQVDRAVATAIVGSPEEVGGALRGFTALGLDLMVLQSVTEESYDDRHHQLELQARRLVPLLRDEAAQ